MKKRNFYMVQVDVSYGDISVTPSAYLPYAAALLSACALEDKTIAEHYALKRMIFLREDVTEAVLSMEEPYLVGFSNYIWNTEYNKQLAEKVKERYPDCLILFGGHNVPPNNRFLEEFPYIDLLIHGEGEIPFKALLLELLKETPDFAALPSLSYRDAAGATCKTPTIIPENLDYPSPYLEGYFDRLVADYPNIKFSAILETSRGCPYQCAYCDWALLKSKIRQFPLERVQEEIKWMSGHKVEYIWGADSNFGFFDRDEQIVDCMIDYKERTGYPEKIRINYAKHNEETVFRIVKKLNRSESSKFGATLSFQSLNPVVLENIGRKNMSFESFQSLMLRYNDEKIRTYSELIIGLPGETYDSFCQGVGTLLAAGQHNAVECYRCVLLPNSRMGQPEFMAKHGIRAVRASNAQAHTDKDKAGSGEVFYLVAETNTMNGEEWIRVNQFALLMQALHGGGLLRFFAICLYYEKGLPYEDFYNAFLDFCGTEAGPLLRDVYGTLERQNRRAAGEEEELPLVVEEICSLKWLPDEYAFLRFLYQLDDFYAEVTPLLRRFQMEEELFQNLLRYQKGMMKLPNTLEKEIALDYDLQPYFSQIYIQEYRPLQKRANIVHAYDPNGGQDWETYARYNVWYGRMGGKALYEDTTIEYI